MNIHSSFRKAFKDSVPVIFGYVPLGVAYGILFNNLGYSWVYAALTAVFIFAGAAQFMAIGLLAAHADLLAVLVSTLILNSRHMFYGISLIEKYKYPLLPKAYLIFGLTDETYSLVSVKGREVPAGDPYFIFVTALNHLYWVVGCTVGAIAGSKLNIMIPGLEFALTALFIVLAIEQFKSTKSVPVLLTAFLTALITLFLFREYMLLVSILMSLIILISYGKTVRWHLKATT